MMHPKPVKKPKAKRKQMRSKPKRIPARDRWYMDCVKQLDCCACGACGPTDAHHWIMGRYSQRKTPHGECIPLCKMCHQVAHYAVHNSEVEFRARFGRDHDYTLPTQRAVMERFGTYEERK